MLQLYGIGPLRDRSTDECVCELFLNSRGRVSKEIQGGRIEIDSGER